MLPTSEDYLKLTWAQKLALMHGIAQDKKYHAEQLKALVELLKPWMNLELFQKMTEHKDNMRINAEWPGMING